MERSEEISDHIPLLLAIRICDRPIVEFCLIETMSHSPLIALHGVDVIIDPTEDCAADYRVNDNIDLLEMIERIVELSNEFKTVAWWKTRYEPLFCLGI